MAPEFRPGKLKSGAVYIVELCSGERQRWRYLGDEETDRLWLEVESGRQFRESSLMYAWTLVAEIPSDG